MFYINPAGESENNPIPPLFIMRKGFFAYY
jgi:hypothetical protein